MGTKKTQHTKPKPTNCLFSTAFVVIFSFFAWFYTAIQQFLSVHPEIKDPRETQNISNHISREHDSFACTYLDKQNLNVA